MNLLRKIKCWMGWHERHNYEEWYNSVGQHYMSLELSERYTIRDWMYDVDRTQEMWLRKCKHCGKRL